MLRVRNTSGVGHETAGRPRRTSPPYCARGRLVRLRRADQALLLEPLLGLMTRAGTLHQQVVLFHLGFNLCLALLFIGFTGVLARWLERGLTLRGLRRDLRAAGFGTTRRFFQPTRPYETRVRGFTWQLIRLAAANSLWAPQAHLWIAAERPRS